MFSFRFSIVVTSIAGCNATTSCSSSSGYLWVQRRKRG
uniref:Uncharacterized protein n=1 Tax=Anopheles dirus TaxID=7168 RepID=A0A182NXQ5_9DIPT